MIWSSNVNMNKRNPAGVCMCACAWVCHALGNILPMLLPWRQTSEGEPGQTPMQGSIRKRGRVQVRQPLQSGRACSRVIWI